MQTERRSKEGEMEQSRLDFATRLIEAAAERADKAGGRLELAYSGGKDSDVLLHVARHVLGSSPLLRPVYKNTTLDPRGTITHARDVGADILQPSKPFPQLLRERGLPSRFARFCCSTLKEYKVEDTVLLGVRREESRRRHGYPPEVCKGKGVRYFFPLLYWTQDDIADYVRREGVQCHPLYYEGDVFHVERRLGCQGCPLTSLRRRLAEFKANPALLRLWLRGAKEYLAAHPDGKTASWAGQDYYAYFLTNLLSSREWQNGLFKQSAFDILSNYFGDSL